MRIVKTSDLKAGDIIALPSFAQMGLEHRKAYRVIKCSDGYVFFKSKYEDSNLKCPSPPEMAKKYNQVYLLSRLE